MVWGYEPGRGILWNPGKLEKGLSAIIKLGQPFFNVSMNEK